MSEKRVTEHRPETAVQREAFELYAAMPREQRSMRKLAVMIRRHPGVIMRWSTQFDWMDRLSQRDAEALVSKRKQFEEQVNLEKQTYINIWKAVVRKAFKKIDGRDELIISPENVSDLEKATKMLLLLQGEATDRIEIATQVINRIVNVLNVKITDSKLRYEVFEELSRISGKGQ